jgi:hypothetical protein
MTHTRTRRWLARMGAALALVVATLVGTVATAGPASADTGGYLICIPVYDEWGNHIADHCFTIPMLDGLPYPPDPDPCRSCPWEIDLVQLWSGDELAYASGLEKGLTTFRDAYLATDPATREQLRSAALDAFTGAAAALGADKAAVDGVWGHDPQGGRIPVPEPALDLLSACGTDIVTAVQYLQAGLADPENMGQFKAFAGATLDDLPKSCWKL